MIEENIATYIKYYGSSNSQNRKKMLMEFMDDDMELDDESTMIGKVKKISKFIDFDADDLVDLETEKVDDEIAAGSKDTLGGRNMKKLTKKKTKKKSKRKKCS